MLQWMPTTNETTPKPHQTLRQATPVAQKILVHFAAGNLGDLQIWNYKTNSPKACASVVMTNSLRAIYAPTSNLMF
jgi:hypothetical protein